MLDVCPDCGSKMKINSTKPEKDCTTVYFKCRACVVTHPAIMVRAEYLRSLRAELKSLFATANELEIKLAAAMKANASFSSSFATANEQIPPRTHAAPATDEYTDEQLQAMADDAEAFEKWSATQE